MLCLLDNMRFYKRFLNGHFCASFFLLSEQSRSNRSQWFTNVAQINLFNYSLSIIPAAEFVEIRIELKIHNIQIITNDFNGSNSLCFRKSFLNF